MRVRPLLRSVKWAVYPVQARYRAMLPVGRVRGGMSFIMGCGRSGTTILGQLLGKHRQVVYLNEPLHYWYAIDARTDNLDFFGGKGKSWFEAVDATDAAARRLDRLFGQVQRWAGGRRVVEKLPINALRMEWLDRLAPSARFVNIIRDGRAVLESIQVIHKQGRYSVVGKPWLHQWWGVGYHKWTQLACEGTQRGFYREELAEIGGAYAREPYAMAAYEWLVTMRQMRASVEKLRLGPDRYTEIAYEDLLADPERTLRGLEDMLGLAHDARMVAAARTLLRPRPPERFSFSLPPGMYRAFVRCQQELGYSTEGVSMADEWEAIRPPSRQRGDVNGPRP